MKLRIAYALSLIISWIVTLDVLKYEGLKAARRLAALNSNIRCIEMIITKLESVGSIRWIVTLDVLKSILAVGQQQPTVVE